MTEVPIQTTAAGWAPAVMSRQKALVQRLGLGAATAMIFSPLLGWHTTATWAGVYIAVQVFDLLIFEPMTRHGQLRMAPWRMALGGFALFMNAACFGSLSVILWLSGGAMGGVCASILLAAGSIYAVVNSPRSTLVLGISIAPHFAYLMMTPVFMMIHNADPGFTTASSIAVIFFCVYCISTWRSIDKAYVSETKARLVAEQKQAEAEAALASRSAFLAAIGHDLRTPIGAILTGSAEMDRMATDSGARANAALITDAGLMMKALLDNLLDQSKLDAGGMAVEVEDFNLRAMLAQTMRLWAGPIREKGLSFRIEGARTIPTMVRGDSMRMRQILNNLVSNALKFTETGSVTLRLRAWPEEPSGHAVLIEVADTGPGMSGEQLVRLFSPFDQTIDGVSARHGGTGLGLAISRDLATLMGGRLLARSVEGQGACFTLSLVLADAVEPTAVVAPLDAETRLDISRALSDQARTAVARATSVVNVSPAIPVAPQAAGSPEKTSSRADAASSVEAALEALLETGNTASVESVEEAEDRPLRVLVVDDHDINRRAVELILTPLGCDIASAADGLAALRLCEAQAFDVIFMDVRMPELDGRETTRRLRAGGGINAGVPVIAVTADTGPDDIAACMAAGMTYFVSKPLTPPALLGALQQVLSGEADEAGLDAAAA